MPTPQPGVYRKGHDVRVADTHADAVKLAWDGYTPQTAEVVAEADYRDLQAQAKVLGISAAQSKAALAEAIANHVPADGEVAQGGSRPTPELAYDSALPSSEDA